ncbi:MAG: helix-turn-helix domain-containing protein [Erysipelotrichales bacterium]|nr:helix-turn-helix domain-containing protein [Erysipelotrichales bacterium]
MKFGDNLKKLRKGNKLSQEELAEKVKVSRQSVSKWETGEAYPEMNNILELCKIFHCNINDLVNDSILDLDSLGEEVRINVVKLKKGQQKKMKGLSKAIMVLARIGKIILTIVLPIIILVMASVPFFIYNVDIKNDELIIKGTKEKIEILSDNSDLVLKYNNKEIDDEEFKELVVKYKEILDNHSKPLLVGYVEVAFIILVITVILCRAILKHLEELFKNINNGDTPFTLVNINHIKRMAYLMIITIILPNISGAMFGIIMRTDIDMGFEMYDIIEILFLFSMSYIFEYGYELQLDSNGKMYGDENE